MNNACFAHTQARCLNARRLAVLCLGGVLCALAALPAMAAEYYVAKNGQDSNPGTAAFPWLTLGKAAATLHAGDTAYVKAGTYNERVTIKVQGNASQGYVTFRNYGNDTVIIDGTGFDLLNPWGGAIEAFGKSYIRIQGFHVQNAQGGTSILVSGDSGASHIQILNNEVSEHNGLNAIGCRGGGGGSLSDILIEGNEVHDCITGGQEAIRIDKNTTRFIVRNNQVHDNSSIGIDVVGWGVQPAYGWIVNNLCYRNGLSRGGAHGIYVDGGTYLVVENNFCFDNWGGISIGAEYPGEIAQHVIVRRNLVYHNWWRGINLGSCASCGRPQNCAIVHNACYDNNLNDGSSAVTVNYFQGDNQIRNNILYQSKGANPYYYIFFYLADNGLGHVDINANCEFPSTAEFYYQNVRYHTLADWQAISGQDALSQVFDPALVSPATQDFRLQTGSQCVDTGVFLAKAAAGGSGTVIEVDNASPFCDGYGGLFPGDAVRVGAQAAVTLTAVDYSTNRLTLSRPLTWNANDGVSFDYLGARPDLGAYEYGVTTTAGNVAGVVTDHNTGTPLPGAVLTSGTQTATSAADGSYALSLPPGYQVVACSRTGYVAQDKPMGIIPGETVQLNWRLDSTAAAEADFTVSPSMYVRGKSPAETIRFGNLPQDATIRVYTLSGHGVATLHHQSAIAMGEELWDIRDMASGIYLYHIQSARKQKRGKIAIVK